VRGTSAARRAPAEGTDPAGSGGGATVGLEHVEDGVGEDGVERMHG
jgi:hypothetical protein